MATEINNILTRQQFQGGDVFYKREHVLDIVADIQKKLGRCGQITLTRIPGNGAEMKAAIEILRSQGCRVETEREPFNKRILSMTVIGPAAQNSGSGY